MKKMKAAHKMQRKMPVVPIQLDSSIAIKMSMGWSMFQEKSLMARTDIWHKIRIVKGTQYDREVVLKAILDAVDPVDFIPVKYQACGEDTFFIARNCGPALEKLCKSSLIVKNPKGDPLILVVTLGYAPLHDIKMSLQPLLLAALTKKYDADKQVLNLEGFHRDPDILKVVYCPLSQQRTFIHVLKLAKSAIASFEYLNLQDNDLSNLHALETSGLSSVKYVDLRNNNLMNMDCIAPLKNLSVEKLWLDGNPLCENYSSSRQYIESAKRYCRHLIQLDGVYINTSEMPFIHTHYFKNESRMCLVNQFLEHFFTLYDQNDRTMLKGLYHKNALYSLSFGIQSAIAHKRGLGQFTANRNLLRTTDPVKRSLHLYHGSDIINGLKKLPRCFHERRSFVCDLMFDDGKCLVFTVGGFMRKSDPSPQILSFSRTFVLLAGLDNEYNIINDQYYVAAAPEYLTPDCIKAKISLEDFVPTCFSATEKKEIVATFRDATMLNDDWCETYLQEARWNLRKAISNFMKDYKSTAIPWDAFR